jgi:hypothetical protein
MIITSPLRFFKAMLEVVIVLVSFEEAAETLPAAPGSA